MHYHIGRLAYITEGFLSCEKILIKYTNNKPKGQQKVCLLEN